ncbi:Uncharacterised protein [uncultured Clostridium sp.]|nr:Uncharacterised protein [uncultured Clostridium sp.]SCI95514.1 Uncharacterised protein [uncultured Clostridium sp.]
MDLKQLLGEELFSQVEDKLDGKKIMVDDGNFIPKARFDQVNAEKKKIEKERETYKTQAERYEGGMTKDEATDFEANLEKEYKVKIAVNSKFSNIEDEGVREFLESKIDKEKLTLSDDGVTIEGLDEQYDSISEKYAAMFKETIPQNTGGLGNFNRNPGAGGITESLGERLAKQSTESNQSNQHNYFGGVK